MNQICMNLDWFEVFTHEPLDFGSPETFQSLGFHTAVREYGTRVYKQMFTVFSKGTPWIEVRRKPLSSILHPRATSIRLVNRACYEPDCVPNLYMFLSDLGYNHNKKEIACVSRVDICLDFLNFLPLQPDEPETKPEDFLRRYLAGEYAKINQSHLNAWGRDHFTSKYFHAIKWGSPSSMVSTKVYNKTLELQEEKNKPYIRQAWVDSGLLSSDLDTRDVWRLEFSINSDCQQWVVDGGAHDQHIIPNQIETFCNRDRIHHILKGLVGHYFRFVKVLPDTSKYKCPPVQLLRLADTEAYLPKPLKSQRDSGRTERLILNRLGQLKKDFCADDGIVQSICDLEELFLRIYAMKRTGRSVFESYIMLEARKKCKADMLQLIDTMIPKYRFNGSLKDLRSFLEESLW